jgi:tetratricopeptide (TPR) repeat protein
MWRKTSLTVTFALVAALSSAQALPKPPRPPAMPAPLPPAPVLVPDLPMQLEGFMDLDSLGLDATELAHSAQLMALDAMNFSLPAIEAMPAWQDAKAMAFTVGSESMDYDRGTSSLDSGRYDRAIEAFDKVIARNGKKADGAMYWKAYALNRLGKRDDASRTIDELLKKYPSSRWANDAKALLIDVRQASGQPVSPDKAGDEELKLLALNGIMMRDPDRGIPMVEQMLTGSASPKLKARALFLLAQSASPRAKTLLADVAKGKGNPDLQLKALDYLGAFGNGPDVPLLVDVYRTTGDIDVKKRVIRSLAMTGRRGMPFDFNFNFDFAGVNAEAMDAARAALDRAKADIDQTKALSEAERARVMAELDRERASMGRRSSGEGSGSGAGSSSSSSTTVSKARTGGDERAKAREAKAKEAADGLWQLYQGESSVELKREILRNMRFTAQADRLAQIARTDANGELRSAAIQGLAADRSPQTTDRLVAFYKDEKDPAVRRQILDSLSFGGSASALVQLARQESDPTLRKRIVERLSMMKDKEAVDYMMEILKK